MKKINPKKIKVGDEVMICDAATINGRRFISYEPGVIERDYRGDTDFNESFAIRLKHNGTLYGVHSGNIYKKISDEPLFILPFNA